MNIAFDIELCFSNPTGMGRFSREILRELAGLDPGNRYTLFHSANYSSDGLPWLGDLPDNFRTVRLPWRRKALRIMGLLGWGQRSLQPHFPEQLQVYFSPWDTLLPLAAGCRIGMIHDLNLFDHPEYNRRREVALGRLSFALLVRRADAILTVSRFSREKILARWPLPPERVGVIYNGVRPGLTQAPAGDTGEPPDTRRKHSIDRPYFLWCGAVWKRKNLPTLLRAYRDFLDRTQRRDLLVLTGTAGNATAEVEGMIDQLDLRGQVRWLGYLPDPELHDLLTGATAFVFPSIYEGFGLPVLEAMAGGTPVVTSNLTALPEVAGAAGLLVDPLDHQAMARAMADLATDAELRGRLSSLGQARAAGFTWRKSAQALLQVFQGGDLPSEDPEPTVVATT